MDLKTIILTGRSGCGKGTQVEKLIAYIKSIDYRNISYMESGDRFRKFIKGDSFASKLSKKNYDNGALQPEFLSTWVWSSDLIENLKEDMHLIFDGTPRRLTEAKVLESAFTFFERPSVDVIYINVSRDWSIKRMQDRGRQDDREMKDVLARLDWFDSDVVPAIDFYRGHRSHKFHEINGEQEIEKVFEDIVKALNL